MDDTKPEAVRIEEEEARGTGVVASESEQPFKSGSETKANTSDASKPTQNVSRTLQGITDKALYFLSHASNETLGACLVGLGATTYFVFGRVGLVIIGVAGGVVLQATWDGVRGDDRNEEIKKAERDRRREAGIEVVRRALEWRSQQAALSDTHDHVKTDVNQELDYSAFDPQTAKALTTFTDYAIKDYVHYWYDWSLPGEPTFPASCRRTLTAFIISLANHLQRKRPADAFLDFVTNASSIIIVFLNELAAALAASPHATTLDAVNTYLEYKPDSSLAILLNQDAQDAKLKEIADDILQAYVDPKAYTFPPARVFLKQVLAQLILGYTVTMCSKPEWINEWIVYLLEESTTTQKVMDIVDAGVEGREDVPAKREVADIEQAKGEHRRKMSRAEEAMDDALQEAKKLTQMIIEEDAKRAREEQQVRINSSEDVSDVSHTHGAPTPTSSQSDREELSRSSKDLSSVHAENVPELITEEDGRQSTPSATQSRPQFTSFDQLLPANQPTALSENWSSSNPLPTPPIQGTLTLLNATISIFDDSVPGEKGTIKAKPVADYLIQIEPSSSAFPGWMIARKYADFEALHEVLRRISVITGVKGFAEEHTELPKWRGSTKAELRMDLQSYLTDAVKFQPLAECEGMKRFLEKDQGLNKSPARSSGGGLGWKLGDDMMNVLSKAPKQVAGGGKAVLGGVTGGGKAVFGGVAGFVGATGAAVTGVASGAAKKGTSPNRLSTASSLDSSHNTQSSATLANGYADSMQGTRESMDSLRTPSTKPSLDRHVSVGSVASVDLKTRPLPSIPSSELEAETMETASPIATVVSPSQESMEEVITLPPPPSEMPEDYATPARPASSGNADPPGSAEADLGPPPMPPRHQAKQEKAEPKQKEPLSDPETSVAVELMFAVITELYTLSSAWNFRRTLLAAAKTFLLRPGNPQLAAIRDLLQSSALDSNLSDAGMAAHIYKMRENALPTAEELEQWKIDYPEKNDQEKEELRVKAKKLLVQKGIPTALQSVMGAAASGEAMGKVFDCLQVESVSRGLVFGLMLQGLKVVTH